MGRAKYSPEMINDIMAAFVSAAKEIIDEDGLEQASIRHISTRAGYSSGTLYLYFEDMEELIAMALVSYLGGYVRDLIDTTTGNETPEETYRRTWALFCKHSFAHPQEYLKLFFGPKSRNMDAIAKKYYELFPVDLQYADGLMLTMLERGNLMDRNRAVLDPLATNLGLSEHETDVANDLTIAFFHAFLLYAAEKGFDDDTIKANTDRFLEGAFFVLRTGVPAE